MTSLSVLFDLSTADDTVGDAFWKHREQVLGSEYLVRQKASRFPHFTIVTFTVPVQPLGQYLFTKLREVLLAEEFMNDLWAKWETSGLGDEGIARRSKTEG